MSDFKTPPQDPQQFTATPESILREAQRLIENSGSLHDRIVSEIPPGDATFENVIVPFAQDENARLTSLRVLGFYQSVSLNAELREASRKSQNMLQEFALQYKQRRDLFVLIDATHVSERDVSQKRLDPESDHYVCTIRREFIKNGLNIAAEPDRKRFVEIQHRINDLTCAFSENAANASQGSIWFTPTELDGVPTDQLSTMKKGDGDNENKLFASFVEHVGAVLRFANAPETRKRMYLGYENRCNENIPIFRELTMLRDESARLLGYLSHAALVVEDKMARNTETVYSLLNRLRTGLLAGSLQDIEHYKEVKKEHLVRKGETWDGRFYVWDTPYYGRKLLAQKYTVDHQHIAEYFPLETTIGDMLQTMGHLFGLVFTEMQFGDATKKAGSLWHDDVRAFAVWNTANEGGDFAGYLYLDLYAREFKPTNPGCYSLVPVLLHPFCTQHICGC